MKLDEGVVVFESFRTEPIAMARGGAAWMMLAQDATGGRDG